MYSQKPTASGYSLRKRKPNGEDSGQPDAKRAPPEKNFDSSGSSSTADNLDNSLIWTLTDDALAKIISFIPMAQWASLERVNRQFQRAAHMNWSSLRDVHFERDFVMNDQMPLQERLCSILDKLRLRTPSIKSIGGFEKELKKLQGAQIRQLAQFEELESINFADMKIHFRDLAEFLETTKSRGRLKTLNLTNCLFHVDNGKFKTNSRKAFLFGKKPYSQNVNIDPDDEILRKAFISSKPDLDPLRVEKLIFKSKTYAYRFFDVMNASRLTSLCLLGSFVPPTTLIDLIGRCTQLERLEFNFIAREEISKKWKLADHNINNKQLLQAVAACPSDNLSILKIDNKSAKLEPMDMVNMITTLAHRSHPLSELSLLDGSICGDQIISAIAGEMNYLKVLELHPWSIKKNKLIDLFVHLMNLEKLTFWIESPSSLKITDRLVLTMVENMRNLERVSFRNVINWNSKSFKNLFRLKNLKELALDDCNFNTATLMALAETISPKLETFSALWGTTYNNLIIEDAAFVPMIEKLHNLRRLEFYSDITDRSLLAIASSCPNLREIFLYECDDITLKGVQAVIDGCPDLKRFSCNCSSRIENWFPSGIKVGKYRKIVFS